jgi:hypothetical protein
LNKANSKAILLKSSGIYSILQFTTNNNPLYDELVLANRDGLHCNQRLWAVLYLSWMIPRLPSYFKIKQLGEYVGGVVGRAK